MTGLLLSLSGCYSPVVDASATTRIEFRLAPGETFRGTLRVSGGALPLASHIWLEAEPGVASGTLSLVCDTNSPVATKLALATEVESEHVRLNEPGESFLSQRCQVSASSDATGTIRGAIAVRGTVSGRQDFIGDTDVLVGWRQ